MANRYHLPGVAGVALIAVAGAAQATVAPPPPGTEIAIEIDKTLNMGLSPGTAEFSTNLGFEIDIQRLGGWSFEFFGDIETDIALPIDAGFDLTGRAYRSFGNLELGAYAGFNANVPLGGINVHWLGVDVEYQAGRLTLFNDTQLFFQSGFGFAGVLNVTEVEFDVNERLEVGGSVSLVSAGGPLLVFALDTWAEFDLGIVDPYAYAFYLPLAGFFGVGAGADLEHQIHSGPFSLIGNVDFAMGPGGAVGFQASGGIRFARGDVGDDIGRGLLGLP